MNTEAIASAATPGTIGPLRLRNRILKTATFEGMCPRGTPSDALTEHHRRVAQGGVGMTTVAYCAVQREGRTYDHQMWMRPEIVPALRRLTDAVRAEGAATMVQLGHSGFFADSKVIDGRPLGPSVVFNTYGLSFARAMSEADIERTTEAFVDAARMAEEAGFAAVEIHVGHGYLLSQFLSPFTNRRRDRWGGSVENRARFACQVVRRVKDAVGGRVAVLAKLNVSDGFRGGLTLEDAVEVARLLEAAGVDGLVMSGGFVAKTPLYMLRGDVPLREMIAVQESPIRKMGLYLFGRLFVQRYPFTEDFFLDEARRIRAAVGVPLVLLGGVHSRDGVARAMAAGFEFVGMGRALIHDPDFATKLLRGEVERTPCTVCNQCIAEMDRGGVRCVLPGAPGG
ncbi:MAG: NADH:flavin oxidoreductase [Myxococcales bacterium]|nr:NADH:flavin oxidoreductase [Myxococcales bacterium]